MCYEGAGRADHAWDPHGRGALLPGPTRFQMDRRRIALAAKRHDAPLSWANPQPVGLFRAAPSPQAKGIATDSNCSDALCQTLQPTSQPPTNTRKCPKAVGLAHTTAPYWRDSCATASRPVLVLLEDGSRSLCWMAFSSRVIAST